MAGAGRRGAPRALAPFPASCEPLRRAGGVRAAAGGWPAILAGRATRLAALKAIVTKCRLSCDPDDRSGEMKIQPGAASQAANMAPTGKTPHAGAAFQDALSTSKNTKKTAPRTLAATNTRGPSRRNLPSSVVSEEE